MKRRGRLSILVAVAALVVGLSGARAATGDPYTKGDAAAMLNNYPPGNGLFDRLQPEGTTRSLDIRPFQEFYGDLTYCAQDWHLLALLWSDAEFVAPTAGIVHKARDAHAYLAGLSATFFLDGSSVAVEKKPIKPWLAVFDPDATLEHLQELYGPDVVVGTEWATQWGYIVAPDQLAPGEHTLGVIVNEPGAEVVFESAVTFTVSQASSPGCAG